MVLFVALAACNSDGGVQQGQGRLCSSDDACEASQRCDQATRRCVQAPPDDLPATPLRDGGAPGADMPPADLAPPPDPCPAGSFCDDYPLIEVSGINRMDGRDGDVWAVGDRGVTLHWSGTQWIPVPGLDITLRGLYYLGPQAIWAAGSGGTVQRWDGTRWQAEPSEGFRELYCVGGGTDRARWAIGLNSEFDGRGFNHLHPTMTWNGSAWTLKMVTNSPAYGDVTLSDCAGSPGGLTAVGTSGGYGATVSCGPSGCGVGSTAFGNTRFYSIWSASNGDTYWSGTTSPNSMPRGLMYGTHTWVRSGYAVGGISGSGPNDVWATAASLPFNSLPPLDIHWNGTVWEETPARIGGASLIDKQGSFWRISNTDHSLIQHLEGNGTWVATTRDLSASLNAVWGQAGDLWAVGSGGQILHRGAAGWTPVSSPVQSTLRALWGSGTTWFAVGDGGALLQGDGQSWQTLQGPSSDLVAIHGAGPQATWAVGPKAALRWTGAAWSPVKLPIGFTGGVAVFARGPNEAYIATGGRDALAWDGSLWRTMLGINNSSPLIGVWSGAARDIWMVSAGGFYHLVGSSWQFVDSGGYTLTGPISGSGPQDIVALASKDAAQVVLRWDGTSWTPLDTGSARPLHGVLSLACDDVWVVADGETVRHLRP